MDSERKRELSRQVKDYASGEMYEISGTMGSERPWRNRSGKQYLEYMLGLQHLFEYIRGLKSQTVCGIGEGTTRGISEISKSKLSEGLDFKALVLLKRDPAIKKYLGDERTFAGWVGNSKKIPANSCGGSLAVFSVAYSRDPEIAVEDINRMLVPGGVFKGVFNNTESERDMTNSPPFEYFFHKLGYSTWTKHIPHTNERAGWETMLATKPPITRNAQELFESDELSLESQIELLEK